MRVVRPSRVQMRCLVAEDCAHPERDVVEVRTCFNGCAGCEAAVGTARNKGLRDKERPGDGLGGEKVVGCGERGA